MTSDKLSQQRKTWTCIADCSSKLMWIITLWTISIFGSLRFCIVYLTNFLTVINYKQSSWNRTQRYKVKTNKAFKTIYFFTVECIKHILYENYNPTTRYKWWRSDFGNFVIWMKPSDRDTLSTWDVNARYNKEKWDKKGKMICDL